MNADLIFLPVLHAASSSNFHSHIVTHPTLSSYYHNQYIFDWARTLSPFSSCLSLPLIPHILILSTWLYLVRTKPDLLILTLVCSCVLLPFLVLFLCLFQIHTALSVIKFNYSFSPTWHLSQHSSHIAMCCHILSLHSLWYVPILYALTALFYLEIPCFTFSSLQSLILTCQLIAPFICHDPL